MNILAQAFVLLVLFLKFLVITPVMGEKKVMGGKKVIGEKKLMGPHFPISERTSCDQFTQSARFNPFTLLDATWLVFYYWAPPQPTLTFKFTVPTSENYTYLHKRLDNRTTVPVNWTARHVLMWGKRSVHLMVEAGDRGQFRLYETERTSVNVTEPLDIRFKQTGDNKVVGFMMCKYETAFAMTRLRDLPRQKQLQEAASRLNYRDRGGKSYLYAGHSWVPIPEMDERSFWSKRPEKRK